MNVLSLSYSLYFFLLASSNSIYLACAWSSISGCGVGMDSKSIRNHRSVSEDESQIVYGLGLLQSFPEGKRKSYHVQKEECVEGGGGGCLINAFYRKLLLW